MCPPAAGAAPACVLVLGQEGGIPWTLAIDLHWVSRLPREANEDLYAQSSTKSQGLGELRCELCTLCFTCRLAPLPAGEGVFGTLVLSSWLLFPI